MPGNRKAKIICTIGPASSSAQTIADLIHGGMDVARLNFSHGETDEHRLRIERIRRIARALRRPVAILQDLQGPKIRVGTFEGGKLLVREGDQVTLTTRDVLGGGAVIKITAKTLPRDLRRGETVLFDDGRIRMEVERVKKFEVVCRVKVGGILSDHKGINLPDSELSIRALTEKDEKDLRFGQKMGVDFVALSFVRTAQDVVDARAHVRRLGTPLIAKIEKPQAVDNLSQIAEAADGIMLARGDLGVESSRPTRAEVSDVANAILDGADAVMLSAETAIGRYPVLAVSTMAKVVLEAEKRVVQRHPPFEHSLQISTGVAAAALAAATQLKISTVVAYTESGYTARIISEFRPRATILALTPNPEVVRRVALYWGVKGYLVKRMHSTDVMLDQVGRICRQGHLCKPGSPVIVIAGVPLNVPGNTNLMTVHRI